ncbi:helix-turn-helix domain-containing protein [Streptomyces solisilvae]|uniref:winged helix-turn-helix transcriptional regulator n=1 Tax=Streptomyces malaysiensis TaxID=92644 RepID=UPI00333498F8
MSNSKHHQLLRTNSRDDGPSVEFSPRDDIFALNLRHALHMLNGEWIPDILVALAEGPKQYSGLLGTIREKTHQDGWSGTRHLYLQESVLNRTLRRLERGELVERHREPKFPYHARYQLTAAADELLTALAPLVEWPKQHAELVNRARQAEHTRQ